MTDIIHINTSIALNDMARLFGSPWFVYAGTLYGITPISIIGVITNLIAYLVLCKAPFQNTVLFKYLRLNALNSLIVSLILLTRFTTTVYKFDFTNTYSASFYSNYFYTPFLSIFYLNGNLLDIIIIVERILNVRPNENLKKIVNSKYFWVILFIISVLLSIPYFWGGFPCYVDIMINNSTLVRNYYSKSTAFAQSTAGQIFGFIMFFIRDVLTLVLKMLLNITSVLLMKNYLKKRKARLVNLKSNDAQTSNQLSHISKMDKNLMHIAFLISVFSLLENVSFIVSYVYLSLDYNEFSRILYFHSNFVILIKHCSNLVIYFYNNLFKEVCLSYFKSSKK